MIKKMLTKTYYIGICDYCGRGFIGHFRPNEKTGEYREQKYCPVCDKKFMKYKDNLKYCSPECRARRNNRIDK